MLVMPWARVPLGAGVVRAGVGALDATRPSHVVAYIRN
jgi:hypothetical protein